jgi:hypothetical protein
MGPSVSGSTGLHFVGCAAQHDDDLKILRKPSLGSLHLGPRLATSSLKITVFNLRTTPLRWSWPTSPRSGRFVKVMSAC